MAQESPTVDGAAPQRRYEPWQLAAMLGLDRPTGQQTEVMAAPLAPLLVVAGAGSGKTTTMAARVVYLVANGLVRPEQILGLTFTRKAAGELGRRIRAMLAQLARRPEFAERRADLLAGEPAVATYHSYAGRVVGEHGLRAGYEPGTRLLSEAACWQLADSVVRAYDGDMSDVDSALVTVTDAVRALAAQLAEHLRAPGDVLTCSEAFLTEVAARSGRVYAGTAKVIARQRARLALLPLVEAYTAAKRAAEAVDFGDQLARAATVAQDHPVVGAIERDRYRVVLLDEYQDTSHAQVVLLRALFGGGHPVTAVGDPCQSIYAWRGASAGTLDRFPVDFPDTEGTAARTAELTVSWRNAPPILEVANTVSAPLRSQGLQVPMLRAASTWRPAWSGEAAVRVALLATAADEAAYLADRIAGVWHHSAHAAGEEAGEHGFGDPAARPTTAVLVRSRKQIAVLEAALRSRGLPVEVVGLGGLLDTPEVRELVATLQVLADPAAGAALLRLLTGPRWRIGPRDLVALHRRARALAKQRRSPRGDGDEEPVVPDRLDDEALGEALADPGSPLAYSEIGHQRIVALADELAELRGRLDQSLPDLVADVENTIGLDVEVAARRAGAGLARGHLDAFGDVAAQFASDSDAPTLPAFLAFLAAAESEERGLEPGHVEVVTGAVQLLTVHAAKGLEWDVVAVAGLSKNVFPPREQQADHWLTNLGVVPFPLRGDKAGLPVFDISGATDQKAVERAREDFVEAWRAHRDTEERRLAYVAITRPRRLLLCSGYWWDDRAKGARGPSAFLDEARDRALAGFGSVDVWTAPPEDGEGNPMLATPPRAVWPGDPLGDRRPATEEAAALVARYRAGADGPELTADEQHEADRWGHEVDLLLAERERTRPEAVEVALPGNLSVSQLVELRYAPEWLARRLRRPLPEPPSWYARRGTTFHRWLERYYGGDRLFDIDELPGAADADTPDTGLAELERRFLASGWAGRTPVAVEVPFTTIVAGVVVRGRMDAVFHDSECCEAGCYDVVDWKTGRQPATAAAADAVAVQLAAYRLAWSELAGVPVDRVHAAFHYVRDGHTARPVDLLDAPALAALIESLPPAADLP